MRIDEVQIAGFGPLAGTLRFADRRAVIVVAENEQGKSSLMSAILFSLFDVRKKDEKAVLSGFRPWGTRPFGLSLSISTPVGRFVIERDFDSGVARVFELDKGARRDRTKDFVDKRAGLVLAERVLGLDRDQFLRTAFVRQDEIAAIGELGDITRKLQEMATGRKDVTAQGAIQKLEEALARYPRVTVKSKLGPVDTEIEALKKQIEAVKNELAGLESIRRESAEAVRELRQLGAEEKSLGEAIERTRFLTLVADLLEMRTRLDSDEQKRLRLAELRERFAAAEAYKNFPYKEYDSLVSWRKDIDTAAGDAEKGKAELAQMDAEREEISEALSELKSLETAATRKDDLVEAEARVKLAGENLRAAENDLESEKAQLGPEVDGEALAALGERLSALSAQEQLFIAEFRQKVASLEREQGQLKDEHDRNDVEYDRLRDSNRRAGRLTWLGIVAGLVLIGLALFVPVGPPVLGWVLLGSGGVLFVLGVGAGLRTVSQRGRLEEKRESLDLAAGEIRQGERLIDRQREKLAKVCDQVGFDDTDCFMELLRALGSLEGKHYLDAVKERLKRQQHLTEAREQAAKLLAELKLEVADEASADDIRSIIRQIERHEAMAARADHLDQEIARLAGVIDEETVRKRRVEKRIQGLLGRARIDNGIPLDEAVERFKEGIAKYNDYTSLKFDIIPQAVQSVLDDAERERQEKRIDEMEAKVEARRVEHPEFAECAPDRTRHEYEELLEELRIQRRQKLGERTRLAVTLGDKVEKTDARVRQGDKRRASLARALERARGFRDAVREAIVEIRRIAEETYGNWARTVDARANEMLADLNPNYSRIKFDAELNFTLVADPERWGSAREWDREAMKNMLSTGARDQVYLAIRLALSEALSSDNLRLPVFLDEPFGSTDDVRFVEAMRFVGERLATRHQVVLLTCHRQWHDWLRNRDPEWFDRQFEMVELPCIQ